MSSKTQEDLRCPLCRKKQSFTQWKSVNTLLNPELKSTILNKTIFTLTCIKCKNKFIVEYPLLYHDQKEKFMIWYIPSVENSNPPKLPPGTPVIPGYRLRTVKTINHLIEKILIFDYRFDDVGVEILKKMVWENRLRHLDVEQNRIFLSGAFIEDGEIAVTFDYIDNNKKYNSIQVGGKSGSFNFPNQLLIMTAGLSEEPEWSWVDITKTSDINGHY